MSSLVEVPPLTMHCSKPSNMVFGLVLEELFQALIVYPIESFGERILNPDGSAVPIPGVMVTPMAPVVVQLILVVSPAQTGLGVNVKDTKLRGPSAAGFASVFALPLLSGILIFSFTFSVHFLHLLLHLAGFFNTYSTAADIFRFSPSGSLGLGSAFSFRMVFMS